MPKSSHCPSGHTDFASVNCGNVCLTCFWSWVDKASANKCWTWGGRKSRSGGRYGQGGYGTYANTFAHRIAYELHRGPVPDDMQVDHVCRMTSCVNPAHLELVTPAENTRRYWATKTACRNGHPITPENVRYSASSGKRVCRICDRAAVARYQARRRAVAAS